MTFIPRLESLRGIAALAVLSHHVLPPIFERPSSGWDGVALYILRGFSNGTGAVVAFFVISGFVLARSIEATPDALRYFRNRVFRLFPAAAVTVALLAVLHHWFGIYVMSEGDFSPGNVLLNMLMIRTDINAVMWSLKVECFATPLILFSAHLVRQRQILWLWAAVWGLFALSFWGPYVHALGDSSNLGPLYAFVVGVLAQHYGRRIRSVHPTVAAAAATGCLVLFWYCGTRKQPALILMLECITAAGLVTLIAWRPVAMFRFLDLAAVRFLGKISYSFYLLHVLGIVLASKLLALAEVSLVAQSAALTSVGLTIMTVIITTPAAYLCWRFVELPSIKLGRTLTMRCDPRHHMILRM